MTPLNIADILLNRLIMSTPRSVPGLAVFTLVVFTITSVVFIYGNKQSLHDSDPYPDYRDTNVILISVDTLRADHLSCYGYPRSTAPCPASSCVARPAASVSGAGDTNAVAAPHRNSLPRKERRDSLLQTGFLIDSSSVRRRMSIVAG